MQVIVDFSRATFYPVLVGVFAKRALPDCTPNIPRQAQHTPLGIATDFLLHNRPVMDYKQLALSYLDQSRQLLNDTALDIWHHPETALNEKYASAQIADILEEAGFDIEWGAGGMPTAFVASWGESDPTIGILGEYDALPGLSQQMTTHKLPLVEGGAGHGCGHNLFGTASMGAAIAAKTALEITQSPGRIRFYGCPAEETLVGKVFMARDKVFF